jgi:hypothetical protein
MNNLMLVGFCVGFCLTLGSACASILNPGSTVTPIPVYSYGPSQFPSANSNANDNGVPGSDASLQGAVWSLGSNLAGANTNFADAVYADPTSGDLEFLYQIEPSILGNSVDSNSAELSTVINGCTLTGFAITGVEQITSATFNPVGVFVKPTSSSNNIRSVSLSSNDQDLTIDFSTLVAPGQYSAILVIETNATSCDQNSTSAIANPATPLGILSGSASNPGSSPNQPNQGTSPGVTVVAPEPGGYGILFLGCCLLLLVHRRSQRVTTKANSSFL